MALSRGCVVRTRLTSFLRTSSRHRDEEKNEGQEGGDKNPGEAVGNRQWQVQAVAKILSNLSLIMVGPVLLWSTVWAVVVDLW